jgi:hypothetical protein
MALITKTVSCTISGMNPPTNYFWTNSGLVGAGAGYVSTSFGNTSVNGVVTVDLQYETLTPENATLTLTAIDAVCTVVKTFNFVYTLPVAFTQTSPFQCVGTGGSDGEISSGSVTLGLLPNGSIPTNYTIDVKVGGVSQPTTDYTVTWNGTNYVVTATNLGQATLSAGIKVITIEVFEISTTTTYTANFNSTSCP